MTADRPSGGSSSWPEPPTCPSCRAPNHLGASACWLCGADLPASPSAFSSSSATDDPVGLLPVVAEPKGMDRSWPRPRISIATMMIAIAVLAVFLAVGRGQTGILGEVAATILVLTTAAALLAAALLIGLPLLQSLVAPG